MYATALGFSAVIVEMYLSRSCFSSHSQINSIVCLPLIRPLSGLAFVVNNTRVYFLDNCSNLPNNITEQIQELNDIVLDYCIPKVYGEAKGYLKYLEDASTLVVPIDRPVQVDVNDKTLSEKFWF